MKRGQTQLLCNPCIPAGPHGLRQQLVTQHWDVQEELFLGAQKRAEMLRHPYILRVPKQRGTKSEAGAQ